MTAYENIEYQKNISVQQKDEYFTDIAQVKV